MREEISEKRDEENRRVKGNRGDNDGEREGKRGRENEQYKDV